MTTTTTDTTTPKTVTLPNLIQWESLNPWQSKVGLTVIFPETWGHGQDWGLINRVFDNGHIEIRERNEGCRILRDRHRIYVIEDRRVPQRVLDDIACRQRVNQLEKMLWHRCPGQGNWRTGTDEEVAGRLLMAWTQETRQGKSNPEYEVLLAHTLSDGLRGVPWPWQRTEVAS